MENPFRLVQPKTKMYSMAVNLKTIKRIAGYAKEGQLDLDRVNQLADVASDCLAELCDLIPDIVDMKVDIRDEKDVVTANSDEELEEMQKEMAGEKPPEGTAIH